MNSQNFQKNNSSNKNLSELSALSGSNWSLVKLGDVCEIILGQSPPSSTYNSIGKGLPFFQGKAQFAELYPVPDTWCSKPKKVAQKNDILISIRAPVGATNIADRECCIGRGLAAIRYSDCYKYIFYFVKSIGNHLDELGTGTTFKAISGKVLKDFQLPYPPLSTQHKIVEKIEELFSELDSGIANLRKAKEQIKTYRQSVLAYAFSGKLTEEFREQNSERRMNEENSALYTQYSALPNGWKWVKLGEISKKIQYGFTESATKQPIGPKFLRITDIQNGKVNWDHVPYCKISEEMKSKYLLNEGNIVFARTGATVGKSFLINEQIPESVFASYLIRIELQNYIIKKFVYFFFQSVFYWQQITEGQVGIGQPNVNGSKLSNLLIPLCSIDVQEKVVSEIERRFSVADKLEQTIDESLEKAEQLKQSILKQAFEGKLI